MKMNWELGIGVKVKVERGEDWLPFSHTHQTAWGWMVVGTNASQAGTSCLFPKEKWEKKKGRQRTREPEGCAQLGSNLDRCKSETSRCEVKRCYRCRYRTRVPVSRILECYGIVSVNAVPVPVMGVLLFWPTINSAFLSLE